MNRSLILLALTLSLGCSEPEASAPATAPRAAPVATPRLVSAPPPAPSPALVTARLRVCGVLRLARGQDEVLTRFEAELERSATGWRALERVLDGVPQASSTRVSASPLEALGLPPHLVRLCGLDAPAERVLRLDVGRTRVELTQTAERWSDGGRAHARGRGRLAGSPFELEVSAHARWQDDLQGLPRTLRLEVVQDAHGGPGEDARSTVTLELDATPAEAS
ncbi:MAG: hypothetical protein R3F62_26280 [Planctomycetota bacterium]